VVDQNKQKKYKLQKREGDLSIVDLLSPTERTTHEKKKNHKNRKPLRCADFFTVLPETVEEKGREILCWLPGINTGGDKVFLPSKKLASSRYRFHSDSWKSARRYREKKKKRPSNKPPRDRGPKWTRNTKILNTKKGD